MKSRPDGRIGINQGRLMRVLIVGSVSFLLIIPILQMVSNGLSAYGIEIDAVQKLLQLQDENGNLTNGRDGLAELAWHGFQT